MSTSPRTTKVTFNHAPITVNKKKEECLEARPTSLDLLSEKGLRGPPLFLTPTSQHSSSTTHTCDKNYYTTESTIPVVSNDKDWETSSEFPLKSFSTTESLTSQTPSRITPRWFLGIAAAVMLASATFDTTATKFMNRRHLPACAGCVSTYFEAPLFQTWSGYIGEFILLPIYFFALRRARAQGRSCALDFPNSCEDAQKKKPSRWIWLLPLLLDFPSTMCLNYSTMLVRASTVQMLRSFNIILTFLLSAFALKNRLYIHQLLGVVLVLIGMTLAGLYEIIYPETETNYGNLQWLGVLMAIAGTALSALQWVLEESIFRRYYCSPFKGVGWMGLYGIALGVLVLIIAHFTGLENSQHTWYQLTLNTHQARLLVIFAVLYVISLSINTASGITVTKLSSSLLRTIINANRTVSIWAIEMILGWETFRALNFTGLVVLILAMLIYNYNYLIHKTDHWCGDRALRETANCFPNKYEVTLVPTSPDVLKQRSSKNKYREVQLPASTTAIARRRTHASVIPKTRYKFHAFEEDGLFYNTLEEIDCVERCKKGVICRWNEIAAIEIGH